MIEDEHAFKALFKRQFRRTTDDCDLDREIEVCEQLCQVHGELSDEADKLFQEVNDDWWNYVWSRLQNVLKTYYRLVPYDEHINAMLETYWNEEIKVWEEADNLFPDTSTNMPRGFYNSNYSEASEGQPGNQDKEWQDYVNASKTLKKARYFLEATVPPRLRRSYVFDPYD